MREDARIFQKLQEDAKRCMTIQEMQEMQEEDASSFARKKHANLCDDARNARNARNPPRNVCVGKQENAKRCEK